MELPTHGGLQLPGILEFAIPCLEFSQNTKNLEKTWSLVILGINICGNIFVSHSSQFGKKLLQPCLPGFQCIDLQNG